MRVVTVRVAKRAGRIMGDTWMIWIVVCDKQCELLVYLTGHPLLGSVGRRHPLWINLRDATNIKSSFTSNQTFQFSFQAHFCSSICSHTMKTHSKSSLFFWYEPAYPDLPRVIEEGQMCRYSNVSSFCSYIVQVLQKFPCSALKQLHDTATGAGKKLKPIELWIQGAM